MNRTRRTRLPQRSALNRGTAVYVGGSRVLFVWPCGCKRTETMTTPIGALGDMGTALLVKNWRLNGVVLPQCKRHPDWHSALSQVARLNAENPEVKDERSRV